MNSTTKNSSTSITCLCAIVAVSSIAWFLWIGNIEYVKARGNVGGLVALQSLFVLPLVLITRYRNSWIRIGILFFFGQLASSISDWIWTFAFDADRGWNAIAFVQSFPMSRKAFLIVFGSWILLGGIQAVLVDAIWRFAMRIRTKLIAWKA